MPHHIYNCAEGCPVESTLQIISGKWKSVIIYHLIKEKNCRFNELQKLMPNCSRRMLSLQRYFDCFITTNKQWLKCLAASNRLIG